MITNLQVPVVVEKLETLPDKAAELYKSWNKRGQNNAIDHLPANMVKLVKRN